jgi:hypothetical protein
MILVLLLFMAALSLEGIGTYISVIGLAATFASDPIILTMAVVLDFCKIIAVNTLAKSWGKLGGAIRTYMICSTLVLSIITSAGVAGYLSNSFQKATLPNQGNDIALVNLKSEQERLYTRKKEIDIQISQLPANQIKGRQRLMTSFKPETDHINQRLIEIDTEMPKLQTSQAKLHTEVGSIMFLAETAGISPNTAVGIIIALIIFVFDPMAIVFLITANNLLNRRKGEKKEEGKPELVAPEKIIIDEEPEPIVETPAIEAKAEVVEPVYADINRPEINWNEAKPDHSEFVAKGDYAETIEPPPSFVPQVEELKIDNVNWPYAPPLSTEEETFAKAATDLIASFKEPKAKIDDPTNWPFPMAKPEDRIQPEPELELVPIEESPEEVPAPKPQYGTDVVVYHIGEPEPMEVQEGIDILKAALEPTREAYMASQMSINMPEPAVDEPISFIDPVAPQIEDVKEPALEEILKEILADKDGSLSDEERAKLDRALDRIFSNEPQKKAVADFDLEELVTVHLDPEPIPDAIPVEAVELPPSLLDDPTLDEVVGANVQHIGPMWVNPKLLEIYATNQ